MIEGSNGRTYLFGEMMIEAGQTGYVVRIQPRNRHDLGAFFACSTIAEVCERVRLQCCALEDHAMRDVGATFRGVPAPSEGPLAPRVDTPKYPIGPGAFIGRDAK